MGDVIDIDAERLKRRMRVEAAQLLPGWEWFVRHEQRRLMIDHLEAQGLIDERTARELRLDTYTDKPEPTGGEGETP